jgi:hypothetical protein
MKAASVLSASSIVLSITAIIFLTFYGAAYSSMSLETGKIKTGIASEFKPFYLIWLFLPVSGFVGILKRNRRILWTSAIAMFLITALTLFSIGLPFLPASLLLLTAAVVYRINSIPDEPQQGP